MYLVFQKKYFKKVEKHVKVITYEETCTQISLLLVLNLSVIESVLLSILISFITIDISTVAISFHLMLNFIYFSSLYTTVLEYCLSISRYGTIGYCSSGIAANALEY